MQGHFEACALRRFWASLLPAAVVEVAVVICLKSLMKHKEPTPWFDLKLSKLCIGEFSKCENPFLSNNIGRGTKPCEKRTSTSNFHVTMGSYDGAETCQLVGCYLLSQLKQLPGIEIGLYRDDGLAVLNQSFSFPFCTMAPSSLSSSIMFVNVVSAKTVVGLCLSTVDKRFLCRVHTVGVLLMVLSSVSFSVSAFRHFKFFSLVYFLSTDCSITNTPIKNLSSI